MKNINLLLPNPLLIYHEKFSPRIAEKALHLIQGNNKIKYLIKFSKISLLKPAYQAGNKLDPAVCSKYRNGKYYAFPIDFISSLVYSFCS